MVQGTAYALAVPGAGGPGAVAVSTAMSTTVCLRPCAAVLVPEPGQPPEFRGCVPCPACALSFAGRIILHEGVPRDGLHRADRRWLISENNLLEYIHNIYYIYLAIPSLIKPEYTNAHNSIK